MYIDIDIGPSLETTRRLASRSRKTREDAIAAALRNPAQQMPPVLYALANALSREPGRAYDAVFWHHVGRLRAVFDTLRCRDKSVRRVVTDLGRKLTKELREFQHDDPVRAHSIARRAIEWDLNNPRDYDHRWVLLHAQAAKTPLGADAVWANVRLTYPESEWPDILRYVHETHLRSVELFVAGKKAS
jgi:hypothetical protein